MLQNAVTLFASAVAGAIDAATGEIPEWLTVPLIFLGIVYAVATGHFVESFFMTVATLALGYALYYTGQLGGGDVLLLAGISAWKPFLNIFVPLPTALVVFVVATLLSGVFYGAYFSLKLRKGWLALPYLVLPPLFLVVYAAAITQYLGSRYREELFVREKGVEELVPEDVLAEDVDGLPAGKRVIERGDIDLLKKAGVHNVKVLDDLPRFGPFIFLALLALVWIESDPMNVYHVFSIGLVHLDFSV